MRVISPVANDVNQEVTILRLDSPTYGVNQNRKSWPADDLLFFALT